ncbi:MAG: hypothetical protein JO069_18245, partial [Verrucomicrobia bacterium]|nr:hypothetical protein [Verrucomicrobiota bacterium]
FADALEQARRDPQLARWFDEQRMLDQTIFQALKWVEAPVSAQQLLVGQISTAKERNPWQRWLPLLALAALVVISAIVLVGPLGANRPGDTLKAFQKDALALVAPEPAINLSLLTPSLAATRAYIVQAHGPVAPGVPAALRAMPTAGCLVTEWHHHRLSLTCFVMPGNRLVHLLVVPKDALDGARLPEGLQTAEGWHIAYREGQGMVMLWATHAPMEEFRQILQS